MAQRPVLSYETIMSAEAPSNVLYMLHGIFGMGRNWASVARRLVKDQPEWGVRLIDLRQHGASQNFAAPHTLEAAAQDVHDLAQELQETPQGILGHSFGGKVALMYARQHGAQLRQLWLIDSTPDAGAPGGSAWKMLQLVQQAPQEFAARQDLVAHLSEQGIPVATAQWMATNLERGARGYHWRFNLPAIEELMLSFFREDLWDVVEHPPALAELHIVKAQESSVLSESAITRIKNAAEHNSRVHYHEVAGGHWVNADNPEALHELLREYLENS